MQSEGHKYSLYVTVMRYIGYTIICSGTGMLIAGLIVLYHTADFVPRNWLFAMPVGGFLLGLAIATASRET